ncbi:MAG TPA: hypothetical protein VGS13_02595 [Stellaceae bacterium]|nr:hypothetical protein [Stellaceae bacterium]
MSYGGTPPTGGTIDVGVAVRTAYTSVWENAGLAVELAWLPFAILVAAEIVALLVGAAGWLGLALAVLVRALALAVLSTIFIVRWYRFMLLGETASGDIFPPGWVPFIIAALKIAAVFILGAIVLGVVAALPPHFLTMPLAMIGGIALAFALARLWLVFPAAAIERPIGLRVAWDLAAGNYWRLIACLVLCYLPFVVVKAVLGGSPTFIGLVLAIIGFAVMFAGAAVIASLLSGLYRQFVGGPGQPPLRPA